MGRIDLQLGNNIDLLRALPDESIDSIVTDPPAGIAFMQKDWDDPEAYDSFPLRGRLGTEKETDVVHKYGNDVEFDTGPKARAAFVSFMSQVMKECYRVLKPGGHALIWALPRTSHWTMWAVEDVGFEIRDSIHHLFGSGFPKNYNIAKGIEGLLTNGSASWNDFHKLNGVTLDTNSRMSNGMVRTNHEQGSRPATYESHGITTLTPTTEEAAKWEGFGTALKPAHENWILARKPISEPTIAANVLKWGTGAINIAGARIGTNVESWPTSRSYSRHDTGSPNKGTQETGDAPQGRWPANLLLTHDPNCVHLGDRKIKSQSGPASGPTFGKIGTSGVYSPATPPADLQPAYHADAEGMETIGDWDCAPGCPVAEIDTQGNNVSRFFQVFAYDELDFVPFAYIPKPSRAEKNRGLAHLPLQKVSDGRTSEIDNPYQRAETERHNTHPTVKSIALMRWLCRLITPPGGVVLDPFLGSGTTALACIFEGFSIVGMDREEEYIEISRARVAHAQGLAFSPEMKIVKVIEVEEGDVVIERSVKLVEVQQATMELIELGRTG